MPELTYKRAQRVAPLIAQELGRLLTEELQDPRIGFVTVTEVRLTDDLRTARVYVSIIGDAQARQLSLRGLKAAVGFLRREIARCLKLRMVPQLHFVLDESLDKAQRLEILLQAASHQHSDPATDAPMLSPESLVEALAPLPPVQVPRMNLLVADQPTPVRVPKKRRITRKRRRTGTEF